MNREQLASARKISNLILRFIRKDISLEQREELNNWICESEENMELFTWLTDEASIQETMDWLQEIDEETALSNLTAKIAAQKQQKVKYIRWVSAAIAASIVVVAGLWIYNTNRRMLPDVSNNQVELTQPGTVDPKVLLITEEGREINLIENRSPLIDIGNNIMVRNSNRSLVYTNQSKTSNNTIRVAAQGMYHITLADGTKVWLNAQSSLHFPSSFTGDRRMVQLEGEGYFEVAQDKSKPFIVQSGATEIRVMGTHFNVRALIGKQAKEISLLEGSVQVSDHGELKSLKPSQEALISEDKIQVRTTENIDDAAAWTKGIFSFNKNSIETVMQQISRWYDVQVKYEDHIAKEFTGQIYRSSSLNEILHMLEMSGDVKFSVKGRDVVVSSN